MGPRRRATGTRGRVRVAAALAVALTLAACSNAGGGSLEPADETETGTASETPTTSPSPEESPSPSPSATEEEAADPDLPPMPEVVRGVYSHVYSFWGDNWANLVRLVEETELNAIVVDVKDEAGTLLWDIDHPLTAAGGADWRNDFEGLDERLKMLDDAGGWAIARIACFKDTLVADARPDLAVQDQSGRTWKARKDFSWLNPYQEEAGQWCIDIGLEALEVGFDEIQFDYIRFPNGGDGDTSIISLPGVPEDRPREEWRHTDQIVNFLASASEQIHAAGGYVSADLFGLVTYDFRWDAGSTGQVIERIAEHVDIISPMVYPSHYSVGNYGLLPHPIEHPYETVWNAMQEAQMRVQGLRAEIRPWLEDFPAPWMGYPDHSPQHVTEQIQATYENGIDGWLLWNAANRYTESILARGEAVSHADPDFRPPARTADPDAPPGEEEIAYPGSPPCDPYPGVLQVGQGNLVGSRPPDRALPVDDPRLCAGVPDGEEATAHWWERESGAGAGSGSEAPPDAAAGSGNG